MPKQISDTSGQDATARPKFTTEDCLNRPFSAKEFPGLEALAQATYEIPFSELTPHLQRDIRERAKRMAADDLLQALKIAQGFFINPGSFNPCSVERIYEAAVRKAEGRV